MTILVGICRPAMTLLNPFTHVTAILSVGPAFQPVIYSRQQPRCHLPAGMTGCKAGSRVSAP
ncbi:MAG: hypothetical protein AB1896_20660, partial [Thermodesulfobacteriota bacterium]